MGIAKLTDQGPFAQAYFAKDVVAPELGGAVKSFDALPQGNHWICSNGALYAEVVLEALLGASEDGSTYPWPGGGDYVDRDAIPGLPLNEVDHVLCVGVAHDPM